MELKTYFAQDRNGSLIPSATVAIYLTGTTTLASGLTTVSNAPLANPFTADADGKIQFHAPDGIYDMQVSLGSTTGVKVTFQCVDVEQQLADANTAADRAETAAANAEAAAEGIEDQAASTSANLREQWRRTLADAGLNLVAGSFEAGATASTTTDAVWHIAGGQCYTWGGTLPKTVPENSTPGSTGGISVSAWSTVATAALKTQIETVQSEVSEIQERLDDTGKTTSLTTSGAAAGLAARSKRAHRLVNKTVANNPSLQYDHFGIMDKKADGSVYMSCRRALNHLSEGYVILSELQNNGTWSTRTIIQQAGVDMRGSSGGTAPTGDIVIALAKMQPDSNPNVFLGVEVHISRDNGLTFSKVADIASPGVAGTYLIPFGKLEVLGNRWVIPCYSATAYANNKLQLLESTDNGATWAVGATIVSGVDANEAAVLDCGDGTCICVARNGNGTVNNDGTHRLLVYRSGDGGTTWSAIGEMRGPDWADNDANSEAGTAGGSGWQLVTPQLSLIHSKGGKPYILCSYTCRRSGVRYRTISVDQFTQSNATTTYWSEYNTAVNLMSPVETFESGYQSQFVQDGQLFINVFRTTTADAVSIASQFQVLLPSLPDFDSGWFSVAALQNYTYNHGLNCIPSETVIMFSDGDDGRSATYGCSPRLYYNGSTTQGAGIDYQVNLSGYTIRTGTYLTFQGVFGSTVGPNRTSGFARLMAWK